MRLSNLLMAETPIYNNKCYLFFSLMPARNVSCPPANKTTRDCEPCPLGFYQDQENQINCHECPKDTSTVVMGTETLLGCYGKENVYVLCAITFIIITT